MAKAQKTNAMRILDQYGVDYQEYGYDVSDGKIDGVSVAAKIGEEASCVFKTLVTQAASSQIYVFVIPVHKELSLKLAAKACGEKSVSMLPQAKLLATTGYVHGGCTALGMKKQFPVFLEKSALEQDHIVVSAGKIGQQIRLAPADYISATGANVAPLTT